MRISTRCSQPILFDIEKVLSALEKAGEAYYKDYDERDLLEEELENYCTYVRIMAELGWPAFLEYDTDVHAEVIACVETGDMERINNLIYNRYGALFLKELEVGLEELSLIHPERLPAIKEALLLYQLGYYYGSVAILITQMEGILFDIDGYITEHGLTYKEENLRLIDTRYKASKKNEKGLMLKTLLTAKDIDGIAVEYDYLIGYLRTVVLRDALPEEELLEHANRHKICHGKQSNYGSKEHALKTILCIDALVCVAEVISEEIIEDGEALVH